MRSRWITAIAATVAWAGGACAPEHLDTPRDDDSAPLGDDDIITDDDTTAGDDDTTAGDDDTQPPGPCGPEMALVDDGSLRFCIDLWEAACDELPGGTPWSPYESVAGVDVAARSEPGVAPQGYISGDQADAACAAAGKRLCTSDEWLLACQGPAGDTWPYGGEHVSGVCNDDYAGHPVVDYFGTSDAWVWTSESMNDPGINQQPGTLALTGGHAGCVSAFGVLDLVGNLHEWVADADGVFRGGFYVDVEINGPGCTYRTSAHGRGYHDYSTGFRCCAEPTP
jgi:formylglycine-generating enzyme